MVLGVIQKAGSLRRGQGGGGGGSVVIEKQTKANSGRGRPGMCVSSLFKKKC